MKFAKRYSFLITAGLICVVIIAILWFKFFNQNELQQVDLQKKELLTRDEFCKTQTSIAKPPASKITEYNEQINKDEYVKYLRRAIDDFLSNNYLPVTECSTAGLLNGKHCADSAYSKNGTDFSMDKINRDYLTGKFIVLTSGESPTGGKTIIILFKNRPEQIFNTWVYSSGSNYYDLRAFTEYDNLEKNSPYDITELLKEPAMIDAICTEDVGT